MKIVFTLNGSRVEVEAPSNTTLLYLLREHLGLTGPKVGCEVGECGACAVLLDGQVVNSCQLLAPQAGGRSVTTIEGIRAADGGPNDMQLAFQEFGAVQCGYCTPGMVMAAEGLLAQNADPTREEIRPVPIKTVSQQATASLHRLRSAWMATRTARLNALRGLLRELGVNIPVGASHVLPRIEPLLDDPNSPLPSMLREAVRETLEEIRSLEQRVAAVEL